MSIYYPMSKILSVLKMATDSNNNKKTRAKKKPLLKKASLVAQKSYLLSPQLFDWWKGHRTCGS